MKWTVGQWISWTILSFLLAMELLFFHSFLILDGYIHNIICLCIGALLGGPIFGLLLCRVARPHAAFRFFLLLGLLYGLLGRWELFLFYGFFAGIAEKMLGKQDAPQKRQSVWVLTSFFYGLSPLVSLWLYRAGYLCYIGTDTQDPFFRYGTHFFGALPLAVLPPLCGLLGARLSEKLLQKHFRKTGAV